MNQYFPLNTSMQIYYFIQIYKQHVLADYFICCCLPAVFHYLNCHFLRGDKRQLDALSFGGTLCFSSASRIVQEMHCDAAKQTAPRQDA